MTRHSPDACGCPVVHRCADADPVAVRMLAEYALARLPAEPLGAVAARRAVLESLPITTREIAEAILAGLPRDPGFVTAWRLAVLAAAVRHETEPAMPPRVLAWRRGDLAAAAEQRVVRGVRRVRARAAS